MTTFLSGSRGRSLSVAVRRRRLILHVVRRARFPGNVCARAARAPEFERVFGYVSAVVGLRHNHRVGFGREVFAFGSRACRDPCKFAVLLGPRLAGPGGADELGNPFTVASRGRCLVPDRSQRFHVCVTARRICSDPSNPH